MSLRVAPCASPLAPVLASNASSLSRNTTCAGAGTLPLSELAGMGYTPQQLEHQARLALYSSKERDEEAVAFVREEHSWVAGGCR